MAKRDPYNDSTIRVYYKGMINSGEKEFCRMLNYYLQLENYIPIEQEDKNIVNKTKDLNNIGVFYYDNYKNINVSGLLPFTIYAGNAKSYCAYVNLVYLSSKIKNHDSKTAVNITSGYKDFNLCFVLEVNNSRKRKKEEVITCGGIEPDVVINYNGNKNKLFEEVKKVGDQILNGTFQFRNDKMRKNKPTESIKKKSRRRGGIYITPVPAPNFTTT